MHMQATVSNYSFIMRNVASKCMYIMLFVKCKKSFQSFQHAKNQFFSEYVTSFWHAKAVHAARLNFILIIFFIYLF